MKKIFTFAVAAAAALAANAADYTVYSNGTMGEGLGVQGWWAAGMDFNADAPDGSDFKTYKFFVDNGGADGSMGLLCGDAAKLGPLHSATLNLSWYAEGTATYTVRLTGGVEENYSFTVNADNAGSWQETAIPVATAYPGVSAAWNDYCKNGGYLFSIIASGASSDAAIYFKEVKYTDLDESWTAPEIPELPEPAGVPVPAFAAADVVSVFGSEYPAACTFGIGGWGQSTQYEVVTIDGRQAAKLSNFNYLGWELNPALDITGYEKMHVDFFPCEETNFGFTPISPGAEKPWIASEVKVGEWNSYDVELSHWNNVNMANVFQIKFDQGNNGAQCYIGNVYFYKDTRVIPALALEATDITDNSAVIKYTVTLPDELAGADVKVYMGDQDVTSADNSYTVEGLEAYTDYSYTFKAVATLNGKEYASDETSVSFKTLRAEGTAIVKYFITNGFLLKAYKVGEESSMARKLPISIMAEMVYNDDNTLTISFTPNGVADIVGFTPEVNIGGEWSSPLTGKDVNGVYTYTSKKTFENGEKPGDMFFWMAYAGGVDRINMGYTVGEENSPVNYGAVAGVELSADKTDVTAGEAAPVLAYAVDADGNFLLNETVQLVVVSGDATTAGNFVTLSDRGEATVKAVCGDFESANTVTFTCLTGGNATNMAAGIIGEASEYATNNPKLATDDNEGTQLEFSCAETQEHTFALDLGFNVDIQMIELVWEGASATQYTVTVESDVDDPAAEAAPARAKALTKTYEVTDGEGGAGVTPRKQFIETTPILGRFVTLNTTKAFNSGWGIKLKELRVMGEKSNIQTGIEAISADSAAPARYFRLDGVEVNGQLPAGIYVKLQGNKASKVFVR
ncbi:MAG: fibronectin type III domain-containing protein [Muribaculaceae bacterium]|nr:fibronectin type III domain-containing protein [Muribaculaceae bacterium]